MTDGSIRAPQNAGTAKARRALALRLTVRFLRAPDLIRKVHLSLGPVCGLSGAHPVVTHGPGYPKIFVNRGADADSAIRPARAFEKS